MLYMTVLRTNKKKVPEIKRAFTVSNNRLKPFPFYVLRGS